jgi:ABC-type sulfate transport system permease subunit
MSTRAYISVLVGMMVNAVVFGIGATIVLSVPAFEDNLFFWMPVVVVSSFLLSPFIAWQIAPMLRSRWQRVHARSAG